MMTYAPYPYNTYKVLPHGFSEKEKAYEFVRQYFAKENSTVYKNPADDKWYILLFKKEG